MIVEDENLYTDEKKISWGKDGKRELTYRVLCEGYAKDGVLEGRTAGNVMIEFPDTCQGKMIGKFCNVKVTDPLTWIVRGELQE